MAALAQATDLRFAGENVSVTLDPEWNIWGPIGGYVAAIALRAAGSAVPVGHRPVTFSCQYLSKGENAPVTIRVDPVKPGSTACVNVRLDQGGVVLLQAQIWTTSKTIGPSAMDAAMPDVPPPDALEPFTEQLKRHGHDPHAFWINVDSRQVDFRAPGIPDPRGGRIERWMRFRDWRAARDPFLEGARALVAIDTHVWPAHNRGLSEFPRYVAPSLDLTVWFHQAAPDAEWLLADGRADVASQALLFGTVRLWSADGRLIATGGSNCLVIPSRDHQPG